MAEKILQLKEEALKEKLKRKLLVKTRQKEQSSRKNGAHLKSGKRLEVLGKKRKLLLKSSTEKRRAAARCPKTQSRGSLIFCRLPKTLLFKNERT